MRLYSRTPTAAVALLTMAAIVPARSSLDGPATSATAPAVIRIIAFSPDGKTLVAGYEAADKSGGILAWDIDTLKARWSRPAPASVRSLSFSSDGKSLAIVRGQRTAFLLDPATGEQLSELDPHPAVVNAVAFIPRTELLATGSDGTIRLWNVKTGKLSGQLKGHPAEVRSLVASPTGKWLVSTGPDTTRIWDVVAGAELKGVINQNPRVGHYGITFLGPDRLMMADNSGRQTVRDLPEGKVLLRFSSAGGYSHAAYSEAAGLAAFTGYERPRAAISDLTFRDPTPAERSRIATVLKDFDDDSYELREAATLEMRKIGSVAEPALRAAMTDGPSAEVRMRARETRQVILDEPLRWLEGHTGVVTTLAFSPHGKLTASGAADGTVRLWDPKTGRELGRLQVGGDSTHPK